MSTTTFESIKSDVTIEHIIEPALTAESWVIEEDCYKQERTVHVGHYSQFAGAMYALDFNIHIVFHGQRVIVDYDRFMPEELLEDEDRARTSDINVENMRREHEAVLVRMALMNYGIKADCNW